MNITVSKEFIKKVMLQTLSRDLSLSAVAPLPLGTGSLCVNHTLSILECFAAFLLQPTTLPETSQNSISHGQMSPGGQTGL